MRMNWLTRLLHRPAAPCEPTTPERAVALKLMAAIDAGGLPLNPAKVNQIARGLGLEVSSKAPMDATIERIRAALARG
jgi:hypothetical protein